MSVEVVHQVLGEDLLLAGPLRPVYDHGVQSRNDPRYLPSLPGLAEHVRDVEETGLEEENEGDPLVVGLDGDLLSLTVVRSNSLIGHILPYVSGQLGGESEGGHDVAVGVDDGRGDAPVVTVPLHDAGDLVPIADPVQGCDQDAGAEE